MHALQLLAAFLLGTLAVARATRLVTSDAWPPAAWARDKWFAWTSRTDRRGSWSVLATCPFCCAPWIAAVTMAVAIAGGVWSPDLGSVGGWWWTLATWAAGSYLAACFVVRDEPPEE